MVSDLSRTLISTNAFGQKNKVPQEAVPQAVQDKVRHVENESQVFLSWEKVLWVSRTHDSIIGLKAPFVSGIRTMILFI